MINRVVFISVLMILSLTATAGTSYCVRFAADTSVIPTKKTAITERPLADKLETQHSGNISTKKTANSEKKVAGTAAKTTATEKVVSGDKSTGKAKERSEAKSTGKAKVGSGVKSDGKTKVVSGENSTSWEEAMRAEKNTGKTTAVSGEKSVMKTPVASKEKSTSKSVTTTTNKAAVTTAANSTVTTTAKTTAAKKTSSVSGKKLAALTPAEKNRAVITKSLRTSKTKNAQKLRKGIGIELFQPLAFKYAILLDVPVEKVTDEKLLEVLDRWYGTRYRFGGETRKGIDCSAFTQTFILSYFDHQLPRRAEEQYGACKKVKKKKLRQGDLVFFKTHGPKGGITHVGVYLINNRFVHSATSTGVRISKLNDDYYKERYAGGGRIR